MASEAKGTGKRTFKCRVEDDMHRILLGEICESRGMAVLAWPGEPETLHILAGEEELRDAYGTAVRFAYMFEHEKWLALSRTVIAAGERPSETCLSTIKNAAREMKEQGLPVPGGELKH